MIRFVFMNKEAHSKNKHTKNKEINDCLVYSISKVNFYFQLAVKNKEQ